LVPHQNPHFHWRSQHSFSFLIHMENPSPHNSTRSQDCLDATKATRLPHSTSTPDLAPTHFFLFDSKSLFNEIIKDTLITVFSSYQCD
jgi:hypothetical protein